MKKLVVLSALFTYACGLSAAPPKNKVHIALIVQDTVDDKGWCQSMYDAIKAVQKAYGPALVDFSYSEKMKPVDAGSAARQYASKHFDIIICHGAQYKNTSPGNGQRVPGHHLRVRHQRRYRPQERVHLHAGERADRLPQRHHRGHGHQEQDRRPGGPG